MNAEYSEETTSSLRAAFRAVFPLFLLSRLWCFLWVYAGHFSHPFREKIAGGYEGVSNFWLNAWTIYDTRHFFDIARESYNAMRAPFFPLYPLLLRLAAPDENAMALLGFLLSNACFLGALILLYRMARDADNQNAFLSTQKEESLTDGAALTGGAALTNRETSAKRARLAVFLMAFSPLSCVFSAVYTESLYAFLLLAAFSFARGLFPFPSTQRWLYAGFFAALAALTRNSGPIIFLALLAQWIMQHRRVALPQITLFFVALPLLSFLSFQFFLARQLGSLAGVTNHAAYGRAPMFPLLPLWRDLLRVFDGSGLEPVTMLGVLATITALGLGLGVLFRGLKNKEENTLSDAVLLLGVMLMQLGFGRTFAPYTNTSLRLMSSNFPFWTNLAARLKNPFSPRLRALSAAFATLVYLLLGAWMSYLFGLKTFVSG